MSALEPSGIPVNYGSCVSHDQNHKIARVDLKRETLGKQRVFYIKIQPLV